MYCSGGHRRQFSGVLYHSIHRRGLCCAHLHHLYLRGSGEALSSGGNLPCQHVQQLGQPHPVFVSAEMFLLFNCIAVLTQFLNIFKFFKYTYNLRLVQPVILFNTSWPRINTRSWLHIFWCSGVSALHQLMSRVRSCRSGTRRDTAQVPSSGAALMFR